MTCVSFFLEFRVQRLKGLFGNVTLSWKIKSQHNVTNEISPVYGQLMIPENSNSTMIQFEILNDDIPERDESYVVELYNVKGSNCCLLLKYA